MLRLAQRLPFASDCVFRDDFLNPGSVMDNGGIIVASNVSKGISPTGISGRVTYSGTNALLINATQATWMLRFRTGANAVANNPFLFTKTVAANRQWYASLSAGAVGGHLFFSIAANLADTANYIQSAWEFALSTEYVVHVVYDGALAAANRLATYVNGVAAAMAVTGTTPAVMTASTTPVCVFQQNGGVNGAPATDFVLREARVYSRAYSAAEVADDYAALTYKGLP